MNQELFKVEDHFKIVGRGLAIVGEHKSSFPEIKVGSAIVFIHPDGTEMITEVDGIDRFQTVSGNKKIAFLIKNVTKEDIPLGTRVLLNTSK